MFETLEKINARPKPYQYYTAEELWTDDYTSKRMLECHLNQSIDVSSRNKRFIDRSIEWMISHFGVGNKTHIADFGCGPGLYTTQLAEKGARVTGIDFSRRSIDYAKKVAGEKKLDIHYANKDYLDFETDKRFDMITMIMCDYCALSPKQRKNILQKFHKLLQPNGSILLDVYSLNSFNQRVEQSLYELNLLDGFWASEKYYGFLTTFKYEKEKVVLDKYTLIEKNRTRTIYNWLQYFSKDSLISEFEMNNFKVENVYADVAGSVFEADSPEMAIVAKKMI